MKKILYVLFFNTLIISPIMPQISINNYKETNNKIECDIYLPSVPYVKETKGNEVQINFKNYRDESRPGTDALPSRDIFLALPSYSKISAELIPEIKNKIKGKPSINPDVTLNNDEVIYNEQIPRKISSNKVFIEIKGYLWIRNYYCVHLKIHQYLFNNDFIEEIQNARLSLSLLNPGNSDYVDAQEGKEVNNLLSSSIVNFPSAKQLNKKSYESLTNNYGWIDFTKTYLKVGTAADGLYRIKKADLENLGISTSTIPANTYKMYMKGNQIPLYVKSSSNVLDDSGYIEFFGIRNMGDSYRDTSAKGNSYKEYLNRYGDTTIYWLTWNGTTGLRTTEQTSLVSTLADTLNYYAELVHYEQNWYLDYSIDNLVRRQYPQWLENQTWVWGQQGVGRLDEAFTAVDIYPNKNTKAFYKVQDYSSNITTNAHVIGLSINSDLSVYDSIPFNRYAQHVANALFSSSKLTEGTNYLHMTSYQTLASANTVAYDWYEVEYPRYLKALNDSLKFVINDLQNTSVFTFRLTNFQGTSPIIYKYNAAIKKISTFNRIADVITFTDTVSPGDKYYLINENKISSPFIYYTKNFVDLSAATNKADYILITAPLLSSIAANYASFVSQNYSLTTKVINVYDIYDQFNFGFFSPEPIKDFLKTANLNWQSPKPAYLFLVGNATYDYYGNKAKYFGVPLIKNLVPSFGQPVSDTWFTTWDSTGSLFPQMFVGRMPASTVSEFQHFYDKHVSYISNPYDDWNKYYLLFSSGNGSDPNELTFLKQINDGLANNYIQPAPNGGIVQSLYKTYSPPTNFGPFTPDQVQAVINNGAILISYLGHSGTQVWDNGINDVAQLKNTRNRDPFISDFGCSTGMFAEPDIKSFASLFVCSPNGDAVGYVGNATLGFSSTTSLFPPLFYKQLITNNAPNFGYAHAKAKIDLLNKYGTADVYSVFVYGNTLFTDPVIKLRIPPKPNLYINPNNISLNKSYLDDSIDSVTVTVRYFNYGSVLLDTFKVQIAHSINGVSKEKRIFVKSIPTMGDSITFTMPVKGYVGTHSLNVTLDYENQVDEIYKNDNTATFTFNVSSSAERVLSIESLNNLSNGILTLINPVNKASKDSIVYQISSDGTFNNPLNYYKKTDTAFTKIIIPGLLQGKRYWFRSKLNSPSEVFGGTFSFVYDSAASLSYYLGDSVSFSSAQQNGISLSQNSVIPGITKKELKVYSAGYYDGGYAIEEVNGNDYLTEGQLDGVHATVFVDSTLQFLYTKRLNYWEDANFAHDLKVFIDTITANRIVVLAFGGSAGIGLNDSIITDIHNLGSQYIDSVGSQYSWAIIGKKGAPRGSVPEKFSRPSQGFVVLDSVFSVNNQTASLFSSIVGPVKKWKTLTASYSAVNGGKIDFIPVGIRSNGVKDTLAALTLVNGSADLTSIDPTVYQYLGLLVNITKGSLVPMLNYIKIDYDNFPEVGTNYQSVNIASDTVAYGENLSFNFKIFNEGALSIDTLKYTVDRVRSDNSSENLITKTVTGLAPGSSINQSYVYSTASGRSIVPLSTGLGSFLIKIDPNNKITEFFKDNNIYSIPFFVKGDTTHPALKVLVDGGDITEGDYISSAPVIKIEFDDPSPLPVTDTSTVTFTLNNKPIYFLNNPDVKYQFNSANPKMVINYSPHLSDGEYILKVLGRNTVNALSDTVGVSKKFQVVNEVELLNVYNYPNPFSKETWFTFQFTQPPDNIKIRIFTVAGRLIKEINSGFKIIGSHVSIPWDGRDSDGDLLANGTYFYKVILKSGEKIVNATQKLVIMK